MAGAPGSGVSNTPQHTRPVADPSNAGPTPGRAAELPYTLGVGRLENIIARNRRPVGLRATVGMMWRGAFILLILALLLFTDWALTDEEPAPARAPAGSARPPDPPGRRIDGVPLLRPPAPRR